MDGPDMSSYTVKHKINESIKVIDAMSKDEVLLKDVDDVSSRVTLAFREGQKVLIAGNGGSAADAQHIAAELVSRFCLERPGLPAIALTVDTSIITAVGNDYGFDNVFARQVQALSNRGDIFIGITTSGKSKNIIKAVEVAKNNGLVVVCFTGDYSKELKKLCDYCICVPSDNTPRIQEGHILLGHIMCETIERSLYGEGVVWK